MPKNVKWFSKVKEDEHRLLLYFAIMAMLAFLAMMVIIKGENSKVWELDISKIEDGDETTVKYLVESVNPLDKGYEVKGYFVDNNSVHEYYNYGNDYHGKGQYNYMHLCVTQGDKSWVLPTKLYRRDDVSIDNNEENEIKVGCNGFVAYIPQQLYNSGNVIWGAVTKDLDGAERIYEFK